MQEMGEFFDLRMCGFFDVRMRGCVDVWMLRRAIVGMETGFVDVRMWVNP